MAYQSPADIRALFKLFSERAQYQDVYADETGVLLLDEQQDCTNFKIRRDRQITKFTYQRKFDTCDEGDYIIEDGTTHIVWAKGLTPLFKVDGLNVSVPDSNMIRVQLLKNAFLPSINIKHTKILDIVTNKAQIPNTDTTYWCHVHKLSPKFNIKHHIYQYEAVIDKENEGIVHHMEVFHCIAPANTEIPLYVGSCFSSERPESTQVCKRVLAAWAMGATMFMYPELTKKLYPLQEAGLPIGGPDFNKYIMLEVHYNNPKLRSGIIDSSGIRFYVSQNLRPMDAGIIELGLEYTDKMAIPPGQSSFLLSGFCVSECTAVVSTDYLFEDNFKYGIIRI
ncbi:dopamine beta hydroxylase related [Holotrichia oblita]|uniref:Dopamine beta hydroxylase related n=1 Tax=Holotrichia oblita TaxID=644536 RepID=A0ACB9SHH3_HOLOL|nr:dopamine beta hydroxylase related [Holotrichia oblita]